MIEIIASILAVSGAILMASRSKYSKYAYVCWPPGAILWFIVALDKGMYGMMTTMVVYIVIDSMGAYKWLYKGNKNETC